MQIDAMCGLVFGGAEKQKEHFGPAARVEYIIHYVINGKGTYICEGKQYSVKKGQSFVIHPGRLCEWFPDPDDPWEYTWVVVNCPVLEPLIDQLSYIYPDCVIDYLAPEKILYLYESLVSVGTEIDAAYSRIGIAYAIVGAYMDAFPKHYRSDGVLQYLRATKYIEQNYHSIKISPSSIAEELNISNSTLYRTFKKNSGKSPEAYLQNYRIEQAKRILEMGASVKSAAISTGFSDQFYFSKIFKKAVGVTPSEYRQNKKNR